MPGSETVTVLGVRVDVLNEQDVRDRLRAALFDPWDGNCRHVATLNPEYVMAARADPGFAAALARADLTTADGIGLAVAARLGSGGLWSGSPARVTGVDVTEWLAAEIAHGWPLFLLGGGQGVADAAADTLRRRFPGVAVAGTWGGGTPRLEDDHQALTRIRESRAHVLLVAYGAPGQVLWIDRNRAALATAGVRLAVGVGGAMDYLAGRMPRAPTLIRRLGLEWLYRLVCEPWRWRRQLVLPGFALLAILEWLWRRGNRAGRYVRRMDPEGESSPSPQHPPTIGAPGEGGGIRGQPRLGIQGPSGIDGPRPDEMLAPDNDR